MVLEMTVQGGSGTSRLSLGLAPIAFTIKFQRFRNRLNIPVSLSSVKFLTHSGDSGQLFNLRVEMVQAPKPTKLVLVSDDS